MLFVCTYRKQDSTHAALILSFSAFSLHSESACHLELGLDEAMCPQEEEDEEDEDDDFDEDMFSPKAEVLAVPAMLHAFPSAEHLRRLACMHVEVGAVEQALPWCASPSCL